MRIPVERLTASPTHFDFSVGSEWWRSHLHPGRGLPQTLDAPLRLDVQGHRMGDDLHLSGTVEVAPELECSRCLARYRHALREPFRLVLEPAGDRRPADPEAAEALARDGISLGDELDVGIYRGSELQLGALVVELVALALPVKPLCREDCAGLCPRCGADRAAGPCGCAELRAESPFAVLAALRGGTRRGGD